MLTGETETTEYKKSLAELKKGVVSLVAMLNKHGEAELWFGITPDGSARGLDITEKTLRDISQAIDAHIEPKVYPAVEQEVVGDKSCIRVTVIGHQKPYYAYGRAYIRVADEDKRLTAQALERMILEKNRHALRWEMEPSGLEIDEVEKDKVDQFLTAANLASDKVDNAMEKLGLLHLGQPNNAAKLFFSAESAELRCAVFATDTSATIIDRQDFRGNILQLVDEAEKYLLKNIHIGMRLDGMRRVDVPEVATAALREAIINAFCHRDWRDPDYVQVAIYKDRIEIRSPGTLYDNLTIDAIVRGNISRRRNPLIADLLRRIRLIEAWGRGVPLILENAPNAQFEEIGGLFITRFTRHTTQKPTQKSTQKPTQKPTQKTTREQILVLLSQDNRMTRGDLADAIGVSANAIKQHLSNLQRDGLLIREGGRKLGRWKVVQQ